MAVACTGRWQYDNYNGCAVITACCRYSCKGSFIEVYNEKIRDLLDTRSDDLKVSLLPLFTPLRRPAAPHRCVQCAAVVFAGQTRSEIVTLSRCASRRPRASISKA